MELRLESFVQDTIKRKLDLYHVVVRQHGEIIGKFDWRENRREDIHSVSKSFLSIAIGIAIDEGILRLDEKPAEIFSDKLPESPSENLQAMTIRDMIMMATGHDHFILQGYSASDDRPVRDAIENDDWVQYALEFDVPYKPGTYWKYNNFGPYLASVIIQERTGERLVDWLKPRLFTPLGIRNPQWLESVKGYTLGCGGLHLSTEELSRFGQLCLNKGQSSWFLPPGSRKPLPARSLIKSREKSSIPMNAPDMVTFSGDVPEIMHTVEMVMPDREFLSYRSRMPVLLLLPMNLTPDLFLTAYGTISFPS